MIQLQVQRNNLEIFGVGSEYLGLLKSTFFFSSKWTQVFWVCSVFPQSKLYFQGGLRFSGFAQVFNFLFSFKVDSDFLSLLKCSFFFSPSKWTQIFWVCSRAHFFFSSSKWTQIVWVCSRARFLFFFKVDSDFLSLLRFFHGLENYTFRVDSDFLSLLRLI